MNAIALSFMIFDQIGINNNDPQVSLDVITKSIDGDRIKDLIVSRLTGGHIKSADSKSDGASKITGTVYCKGQ